MLTVCQPTTKMFGILFDLYSGANSIIKCRCLGVEEIIRPITINQAHPLTGTEQQ